MTASPDTLPPRRLPSIRHARFHQLDSYRVVPAQLSLGDPRAKKT